MKPETFEDFERAALQKYRGLTNKRETFYCSDPAHVEHWKRLIGEGYFEGHLSGAYDGQGGRRVSIRNITPAGLKRLAEIDSQATERKLSSKAKKWLIGGVSTLAVAVWALFQEWVKRWLGWG